MADINRFFIDILNPSLTIRSNAILNLEDIWNLSTTTIANNEQSIINPPLGPIKKSLRTIITQFITKSNSCEKIFKNELIEFLKNFIHKYIESNVLNVNKTEESFPFDILSITKEILQSVKDSSISDKALIVDKSQLIRSCFVILQFIYNEKKYEEDKLMGSMTLLDFTNDLIGMNYFITLFDLLFFYRYNR